MKIVLVTTGLGMGGAEVLVKELALRLRRRGHAVAVLSLKRPEYFVEELRAANVLVVNGDLAGDGGDGIKLARLFCWLWRHSPDVVHAHLFHANIFARMARFLGLARRTICSIHNTYELGSRAAASVEAASRREWIYRLTETWCDLTAQISRQGLERYRRLEIVGRSKSTLVYNGIELSTISPRDSDRAAPNDEAPQTAAAFHWVSVGRHVEQKNFPLLFRAAAALREKGYRFKVTIYGDGPLREPLTEEIRRCGVSGTVELAGILLDVRSVLSRFDGFVLSSNFEGLPIVLIEAAAAGLPIVATDTGGCAEIFDHRKGGGIVSPGDLNGLVAAMAAVMDRSVDERHHMGNANRRQALGLFDIETIVRQWENIYGQCRPEI